MALSIGEKFIENDTANIATTSGDVEPTFPAVLTNSATDPSEAKVATDSTDVVSGIFIESGVPGGEATYCKLGIVKIKTKGTVNVNDRLGLDATDPKKFVKVTTGMSYCRAKTAASVNGDIVYAEIEPMWLGPTT